MVNDQNKSRGLTSLPSAISLILFTLGLSLAAIGCGGPEYPACETDEDCKEAEFCVNKMCQQCRSDDDCGAGMQCAGGACQAIPGYCTSDADCAAGESCQNNSCVAVQSAPEPPRTPQPVATGCELQSVYFSFDSSDLEGGSRAQLQSNADCIRERGIGSIHLTGMTDPRGTEEYNMALGDRRARAAKKYLETLGVKAKISNSSMGEEMASGSDESGWARDRRVDLKER